MSMPRGLGHAYGQTIDRVKLQDEEVAGLAMLAVQWIFLAYEPMRFDQLSHALAVKSTESDTDIDQDNFVDCEQLLQSCLGLLHIENDTDTVRLVHMSLQEYLTDNQLTLFPSGHADMARTCIQYLNFKPQSYIKYASIISTEYILLEYAIENWGRHARAQLEKLDPVFLRLALRIYTDQDTLFQIYITPMNFYASRNFLTEWVYKKHQPDPDPYYSFYITVSSQAPEYIKDTYARIQWVRYRNTGNPGGLKIQSYIGNMRPPIRPAHTKGAHAAAAHFGLWELLESILPNSKTKADDDYLLSFVKDANIRCLITGRTPLSYAIYSGYVDIVERLVERDDVDVNIVDETGNTPLTTAAWAGNDEIVRLLLGRNDIDKNSRNRAGDTSLMIAVLAKNQTISRLLLENGVDANLKGYHGNTALLLAISAEYGSIDMVKLLLERNNVNVNAVHDVTYNTPLCLAVNEGNEHLVGLLLKRGDIKPNLPEGGGRSPLSCAVLNGHEGLVRLLLGREDVDVNLQNEKDGYTALHYAVSHGHEEIVRILLKQDNVNINARDKYGWTPLFFAVETSCAIMKLLLERNDVEADSKDEDGRTPLSHAAQRSSGTILPLLKRNDVDANLIDEEGRTPLSYAAEGRQPWLSFRGENHGPEAMQLLLDRDDVQPDSQDIFGRTPISYAAEEGSEQVVLQLLAREARDDVVSDSRDHSGQTPLAYAAQRSGRSAVCVVRLLLEREAAKMKKGSGEAHVRELLSNPKLSLDRTLSKLPYLKKPRHWAYTPSSKAAILYRLSWERKSMRSVVMKVMEDMID